MLSDGRTRARRPRFAGRGDRRLNRRGCGRAPAPRAHVHLAGPRARLGQPVPAPTHRGRQVRVRRLRARRLRRPRAPRAAAAHIRRRAGRARCAAARARRREHRRERRVRRGQDGGLPAATELPDAHLGQGARRRLRLRCQRRRRAARARPPHHGQHGAGGAGQRGHRAQRQQLALRQAHEGLLLGGWGRQGRRRLDLPARAAPHRRRRGRGGRRRDNRAVLPRAC